MFRPPTEPKTENRKGIKNMDNIMDTESEMLAHPPIILPALPAEHVAHAAGIEGETDDTLGDWDDNRDDSGDDVSDDALDIFGDDANPSEDSAPVREDRVSEREAYADLFLSAFLGEDQ